MKLEKNKDQKSTKAVSSNVFYIIALIVAIAGIALLVNNIILFKQTVAQYVSQGYTSASVTKQLIPSQLLPDIFNTIGLYGGISAVLFAAGIINTKVSNVLALSDKDEVCSNPINDIDENSTSGEAASDTETAEQNTENNEQ